MSTILAVVISSKYSIGLLTTQDILDNLAARLSVLYKYQPMMACPRWAAPVLSRPVQVCWSTMQRQLEESCIESSAISAVYQRAGYVTRVPQRSLAQKKSHSPNNAEP